MTLLDGLAITPLANVVNQKHRIGSWRICCLSDRMRTIVVNNVLLNLYHDIKKRSPMVDDWVFN